jgi:ankyrin repeat protein
VSTTNFLYADQATRLSRRLRAEDRTCSAPAALDSTTPLRQRYLEVPIKSSGSTLCRHVMSLDEDAILAFIHRSPFYLDDWDEYGRSALHVACTMGEADIVMMLVTGTGGVGADIHARSSFGLSAAHYAAGLGHDQLLRQLIFMGADVNARTDFNATPLDLARLNRRITCQRVLQWVSAQAERECEPDESLAGRLAEGRALHGDWFLSRLLLIPVSLIEALSQGTRCRW